jgi:hypothetical protein
LLRTEDWPVNTDREAPLRQGQRNWAGEPAQREKAAQCNGKFPCC